MRRTPTARRRRWEQLPRDLRREVIDGIRIDGVHLEEWPDTREHGEATNAVVGFLERVERSNVARVSYLMALGDQYDVVW